MMKSEKARSEGRAGDNFFTKTVAKNIANVTAFVNGYVFGNFYCLFQVCDYAARYFSHTKTHTQQINQ
jgi:hypothetical protein